MIFQLEKNSQFIVGGVLESREETDKSRETSRELKRARFELVLKEYEVHGLCLFLGKM